MANICRLMLGIPRTLDIALIVHRPAIKHFSVTCVKYASKSSDDDCPQQQGKKPPDSPWSGKDGESLTRKTYVPRDAPSNLLQIDSRDTVLTKTLSDPVNVYGKIDKKGHYVPLQGLYPNTKGYKRFQNRQTQFIKANAHRPVYYLRRGPDGFLIILTCGMMFVCAVLCIVQYYDMIFPSRSPKGGNISAQLTDFYNYWMRLCRCAGVCSCPEGQTLAPCSCGVVTVTDSAIQVDEDIKWEEEEWFGNDKQHGNDHTSHTDVHVVQRGEHHEHNHIMHGDNHEVHGDNHAVKTKKHKAHGNNHSSNGDDHKVHED